MGATRVVITGAAGGLGSAAVGFFANAGAQVAAIVHEARVSDDLRKLPRVTEVRCDVADRDDTHRAFREAAQALGGIDALIHAAAVEELVPAAELTSAQVERMLLVNVGGTIYTNQAAYEVMRTTGGGSIVNFHSIAGIRGFRQLGHYAASKAAVAGWTRVAAMEWGADGVRVNAIAPVMMTTMAKNFRARLDPDELAAFQAAMREVIHLNDGEYGDPTEEISPVLEFLVSDAAKFITGQTIAVDGGWVKLAS